MTTIPTKYIMENPREAERLETKTQPDMTRQHLGLVGLRRGARALDAGAGTGAVARMMAEIVGPTGAVVAMDASPERLQHGRQLAHADGLTNLEFVQGNLYEPPLAQASFDFVWCRFVFEYLADPDAALRQLIQLAKPGAKVVVGDLDGNTLFHYPEPELVASGWSKIMKALEGSFDPNAGRKLFHRFRKAGLKDIQVHCLPYHMYPGSLPARDRMNWETKFRTIREVGVKTLGGEREYDAFVKAYFEMLDDPDSLTYSIVFLVEGIR